MFVSVVGDPSKKLKQILQVRNKKVQYLRLILFFLNKSVTLLREKVIVKYTKKQLTVHANRIILIMLAYIIH